MPILLRKLIIFYSIAGILVFAKSNFRMFGSLNHPQQLRFRYQRHQGMVDKRSESDISTIETKKAAVLSHMGSRTATCLLILF